MDRDAELVKFLDKYYLGIDIDVDKMNNEQLVQFLTKVIKDEINKSDKKIDEEKLEKCSELLEYYTNKNVLLSDQELEANFMNVIGSKDMTLRNDNRRKSVRPRAFALRIVGIAAIIVVVSTLTLNAVAIANGYSNAWEYAIDKVSSLLKLEVGESISDNEITVFRSGENKVYQSISDFIKQEKLELLYPHKLPDDVKLSKINIIPYGDGKERYVFEFSDRGINIVADEKSKMNVSLLAECDTRIINGVTYYIIDIGNNEYQAICQNGGFEYIVTTYNYETLITIIENMGE